ncbi:MULTISPECIES: PDDEXK nuclease domain-containing protein [Muribaculaceae]|jgi:predicted nuclease of restriction endonuclease-like (RecB) superfamily|uniref:PDDEXK nuclease domain-containing protein n=2 Tax=Bacteroidales TaxID=171549 RepID=UPI00244DBCEC|nr:MULTISPECIES: PDDEXK nuclease domain-containing protein [Bacteroidales]
MTQDLTLSQNKEYRSWVKELKQRYLSARLKASVDANRTLLEYYWSVGRDIEDKQYANTYGSKFYETLSHDMRSEMSGEKGFSEGNIRYMYRFYQLYNQLIVKLPQSAEDFSQTNLLQGVDDSDIANLPQLAERLYNEVCSIPWDHQRRIIDKCKGDAKKALFFVRKVIENSWGRDVLLNFLGTDLYERQAKALTNFSKTLPAPQSDLAQQTTKDPYVFNFLAMTEDYNERELEDALVANVTKFLVELGTGFAYMGRQYRLQVGEKEIFIDLLFYNTRIHAYCCVELKTGSFEASHLGQLGLYVTAVNHQLKTEYDNPTIGLLICKDKDNIEAQYSLEAYNLPLGISQYELSKLIPKEIKSSLPSIEQIESTLEQLSENDEE